MPTESSILKLLKLPYLGWKYKEFCRTNQIDISFALTNRPAYISIIAKLFGNEPYTIISERTTPSQIYGENNLLSLINKILIKRLYPVANLIVANSMGNRQDLIDNFCIKSDKIKVIHNPFDLAKIKKMSFEKISGIDFDRFTFVSAGRLDKGKNHQLLIRAFALLKETRSQLILLGEGEERKSLMDMIQRMHLDDRIYLIGFDPNPYKYFSKSDVFVFASRYEGFPNVLVEAMACGLPVISTDCQSGPREILQGQNSPLLPNCEIEITPYGLLVPLDNVQQYANAMNILIEDNQLKNKLASEACSRAEIYAQEDIIDDFLDIIS
jgi:N-acetylgalactosamine-N,N'-diacetylbacillosaminyl-diphospho-undecaprenol 4-alpha-N-acetylgalactosaminyltransferase